MNFYSRFWVFLAISCAYCSSSNGTLLLFLRKLCRLCSEDGGEVLIDWKSRSFLESYTHHYRSSISVSVLRLRLLRLRLPLWYAYSVFTISALGSVKFFTSCCTLVDSLYSCCIRLVTYSSLLLSRRMIVLCRPAASQLMHLLLLLLNRRRAWRVSLFEAEFFQ